jgi:hypothetical protein
MSAETDAFLYLLKIHPTLLPAAPAECTARDMGDRVGAEVHVCLRCGDRARCALVAHTEIGPRWLDICQPCLYWLRTGADPHHV